MERKPTSNIYFDLYIIRHG